MSSIKCEEGNSYFWSSLCDFKFSFYIFNEFYLFYLFILNRCKIRASNKVERKLNFNTAMLENKTLRGTTLLWENNSLYRGS